MSIKWGCIQPLTGGMYIGALKATGCSAQWIISYPGKDEVKKDKEGNITSCGNEYNLTEWLKKTNQMVPYYHFSHEMFQDVDINNAKITLKDGNAPEDSQPSFDDMDLVVAVPVCSGLSNVTIAKEDTKDERNCNMLWIAKYVLNVVKPKVYIFENAPGLVADKGESVRGQLENIALNSGYSIVYYKTDTKYHHNCQKRPRTFVCFFKHTFEDVNIQLPPIINFEKDEIDTYSYLAEIPSDASQQIPFKMGELNMCLLKFINEKVGEGWRDKINSNIYKYVTDNNMYDEFCELIENSDIPDKVKKQSIAWVKHTHDKLSRGLNYYSTTMCTYGVNTPSVQFKTIQTMIHHKEDRLINCREALHLMGMPHDFELQGDIDTNGPQIGQNVPVNTAKWIVSEAVRIINDWNNISDRGTEKNVLFIDNTKQHIEV